MTSKRKQFRAIFLATLMVLSVFAGTVAFAGSASAVDSDGDATVSPDTIESNTTQEHTIEATFSNYTADGESDTLSASAPDGVTVESVDLSATTADGTELNVTSVGGGTWEIEDNGEINDSTEVTITADANVTAPSVETDTEGEFELTFEDSDGTTATAAAPVTVTAGEGNETTTENETTENDSAVGAEAEGVEAEAQTDTDSPRLLSATHYADGGSAVVEVAFSEDVENASAMSLYVDGEEATDATISETDGRVVIDTGSSEVNTGDVTVNVPDNVTDVDGNSVSSSGLDSDGNVSVDVATVSVENGTTSENVYQGESVAVLADNGTDVNVEVEGDDSNYVFDGSTGTNSQVFLFNTTTREIDQYNFTIGTNGQASIEVRDLGFNMTVNDQNVTTGDSIEGTVTANAGNRDIEVMLLDSNGEEVESIGAALNGQGEYNFEFDTSDAEAGEYTVEARDNGTGVTDTSSTINVAEAGEGQADFENSIVTEARGDVVEMNITMENTDTSTVTIGSEDVGFVSNVTVEDGNDDGVVTLHFNTWEATDESGDVTGTDVFSVADSGDSVQSATIDEGVGSLLDAGDYDLEVRAGSDASVSSQNVATLVLEERETRALNTWTAPAGTTFESKEDVYDAARNGNLTQDQEIASGDMVVQHVNASGLAGVLDAQDSDEISSTFFDAESINYTVEQAEAGPNREPFELALEGNATVIADAENDSYFIAYNPTEATASDRLDDDEALTGNFTVVEGELADEDQTVESDYQLTAAEYDVEEPVNVTATDNQSIGGETSLAPGTEIQMRVRSTDDTTPSFLKTGSAYVTQNGTFNGTFDFSEQSANDTFTVTISSDHPEADDLVVDGNVVSGGENQTGTGNQTDTGNETATGNETTAGNETTTEGGETTTAETTTAGGQTTTAAAETGDGGGGGGEETGTGTPGFGVVVALVALVAAALLAIRRD